MSKLKNSLIKLGYSKPELRVHIRPILDKIATELGRVPHEIMYEFRHPEGRQFVPEFKREMRRRKDVEFESDSYIEMEKDFDGKIYCYHLLDMPMGEEYEQERYLAKFLSGVNSQISEVHLEDSVPDFSTVGDLHLSFDMNVIASSNADPENVIGQVEGMRGTYGGAYTDVKNFSCSFKEIDYDNIVFECNADVAMNHHFVDDGRVDPEAIAFYVEDTMFDNVKSLVRGARGAAVPEVKVR